MPIKLNGTTILDESTLADTSLSNLTDTGKIVGGGLALHSSTYTDLTLGASGTSYIAPANGWFAIQIQLAATTSSAGSYCVLYNDTSSPIRCSIQGNPQGSSVVGGFIPVRKGETCIVTYANKTSQAAIFRFYYAEGSKSEAN